MCICLPQYHVHGVYWHLVLNFIIKFSATTTQMEHFSKGFPERFGVLTQRK